MQKLLYLTDHFWSALGKNYPRSLRFQVSARPSELLADARDFSRAPSLMKPWGFGNLRWPPVSYHTFCLFYCILYHVPACGCASERLHRSRCPQLNFPITYLCLLCLPAALFSFLPQKKKTRRPCLLLPLPGVPACCYTCTCRGPCSPLICGLPMPLLSIY